MPAGAAITLRKLQQAPAASPKPAAKPSPSPSPAKPSPPPLPPVQNLDLPAFYKLWQDTVNDKSPIFGNTTFIDVRPRAFFEISHIPGARSVPATLAKKIATQTGKKSAIDTTKNLACYGTDAKVAATTCREFTKVKVYQKVSFYALNGAYSSWVTAKYPTEAST